MKELEQLLEKNVINYQQYRIYKHVNNCEEVKKFLKDQFMKECMRPVLKLDSLELAKQDGRLSVFRELFGLIDKIDECVSQLKRDELNATKQEQHND